MAARHIGTLAGLLILAFMQGAKAQQDLGVLVSSSPKTAMSPSDSCAEPENTSSPALRQFFPFLGDWRSTSVYKQKDGPDLTGSGTEKILRTMNGRAIEFQSEFEDPSSPGSQNFVRRAVWMVRPGNDALVGVAVNSLGNRKFLEGAIDAGDLVVIVRGEMFAGADQIERYRYHLASEDRIDVSLLVSADGGATWKDGGWEAVYERAQSGAGSNCM